VRTNECPTSDTGAALLSLMWRWALEREGLLCTH